MNIKVAFLGGGPFGNPTKQSLENTFGLVPTSQAEIWVVASYGRILKPREFNQPKYGALVVHPSLLPRYRGATPVQATLMNGDKQTGVTIIKIDEQVDHGPIIAQQTLAVSSDERYVTLISKLGELGGKLLVKTLPKYLNGEIQPAEQNHPEATFTKKLTREDGLLDLTKPADQLERQIRAYWPWPGSFIWLADQDSNRRRLIIHQAIIKGDKLVLEIVQLEGKAPVSWQSFKNGWRGIIPAELNA